MPNKTKKEKVSWRFWGHFGSHLMFECNGGAVIRGRWSFKQRGVKLRPASGGAPDRCIPATLSVLIQARINSRFVVVLLYKSSAECA